MKVSRPSHGFHPDPAQELASFGNGGNTMDRSLNRESGVRGIWRGILWGTLALLLLTPALAMQFTAEVDWSASDFIIIGVLLATLGLGFEAAMRLLRDWPARLAASAAVLLVFLAVWVELAVGVFATPFAGS
jgi:hypothetical protein